jgi:hypothetical protein
MHSVDLLEEALEALRQLGFRIREDLLEGGGGVCHIKGKPWLFLDCGQSPREQLELACEALAAEPQAVHLALSPPLRRVLDLRKSA